MKKGVTYNGRKKYYGFGINDADYVTTWKDENGKQQECPFFKVWRHLIQRCFDPKYRDKNKQYINVTICQEWLNFSNFKHWMEKQDWQGKYLDKDIIKPNNKHYCPELCALVDRETNNCLLNRKSLRGNYPQGVSLKKGYKGRPYTAQINRNRKLKWLGNYKTVKQAFLVYVITKYQMLIEIAERQTDKRVKYGLKLHAKLLANNYHEYDNS